MPMILVISGIGVDFPDNIEFPDFNQRTRWPENSAVCSISVNNY